MPAGQPRRQVGKGSVRDAGRPAPPGSIRVLARAQQDAVWDRQQAANKLRSLLREYYPTLLATFEDLTSRDAGATTLRRPTLRAALIRAGRRRNLDRQVDRILTGLRAEQFHQPDLIQQAMGQAALAHLRALDAAAANV